MASFTNLFSRTGRFIGTLLWIFGILTLLLIGLSILHTHQIGYHEAMAMVLLTVLSFKFYVLSKKEKTITTKDKMFGTLFVLFIIFFAACVFIFNGRPDACADAEAHPDQAIAACTKTIEAGTVGKTYIANAFANRGLAYTKKKQFDQAMQDCNRALELDPDNLAAFVNRGLTYTKLDKNELAIKDFTQALRVSPNQVVALSDRGFAYENIGSYDLALNDLNQAIQLKPDFTTALKNRATIYTLQKRYDMALKDVDAALRTAPNDVGTIILRGVTKDAMHEYTEAIQDYDLALKLKPDNPQMVSVIFAARASSNLNKGLTENADKDLAEAFRLDPKSIVTLSTQSAVFMGQGEFGKAIADLDQAVQQNPTEHVLFSSRGLAKYYGDSPQSAVDDFATALRLSSTDEDKITATIWLHLARVHAGQNDQKEFERNSKQPLADKWPLPILALYRGEAKAEDVFAKAKIGDAVQLRDQACDADFYVGELYLLKGKKDDAKPLFRAATNDCARDEVGYPAATAELKNLASH